MKPIIIFGLGDAAQLARFYFERDSGRTVAAFTVDANYVPEDGRFEGLPVVPFEKVAAALPPASHDLFVALGYSRLNGLRKEKYLAAKALGYQLPSYVSSRASVLNGSAIGDNCFILEDNTVQPFSVIGNNVTMWSGNHLGHHSVIGDHCFLASHIVVSGRVDIGEACFIGVNATLRDHITIGERSIIGAGTVILGDVAPEGVYIGHATERSPVPSTRLRKI